MQKKEIIIVLGSGRSGTSLITNLLANLGMRLSDDLVAASEQNPRGAFEDKTISEYHHDILNKLHINQSLPLHGDFNIAPDVAKLVYSMKSYVSKQVTSSETIWGVKDPRTSILLPLWISKILNTEKIIPHYILAVRNPSSVVSSMIKQYNKNPSLSELVWLVRNVEALRHTGGNVFIIHYEDLFSNRASSIIDELLKFTGLIDIFKGNLEHTVKETVSSNLNRSQWENYEINNRYVKSLYACLETCKGIDFDRKQLMMEVNECHKIINEFIGWPTLTNHLLKTNQIKLEEVNERDEIKRLVNENQKLLKENLLLSDQLVDYKILKQSTEKFSQEHSVIPTRFVTKESYSYRLGRIFVAIAKKEKYSIILAPSRLVALLWDVISGRGRKKQSRAAQEGSYHQTQQIKQSKSHRLGKLIISSIKSPSKFLSLPSEVKKLRHSGIN